MFKSLFLCLGIFFVFSILTAHEGHQQAQAPIQVQEQDPTASLESYHASKGEPTVKLFGGRPENWFEWLGSFHFIFLHFPIALITMTAVSELLYFWNRNPLFNDASRFMIIAAAIFALPTALLGLTYSLSGYYEGVLADYVKWHMWLGIATASLAIAVAMLRENSGTTSFYYASLFGLLLLVNITAMIGGFMTFGPNLQLLP